MKVFYRFPNETVKHSLEVEPETTVQQVYDQAGGTPAMKATLNALVDEIPVVVDWSQRKVKGQQVVRFVPKK